MAGMSLETGSTVDQVEINRSTSSRRISLERQFPMHFDDQFSNDNRNDHLLALREHSKSRRENRGSDRKD